MIEGKTQQETIHLTALALGISELEAEFIIALEQGEFSSDVEVLETSPNMTPQSVRRSPLAISVSTEIAEYVEV